MITKEESFPRSYFIGSARKLIKSPSLSSNQVSDFHVPEDEQLFKSRKRKSSLDVVNKKKKIKKNTSLNNKTSDLNQENLKKTVIENLSLKSLIDDMVVLGCLQEIMDFELRFSITGGMLVTVPITNISTPYSQLIQNFANNLEEKGNNVGIPKLTSIFSIGDYFPIRILFKRTCDKFGHTEIIGSINPKDIYHNFNMNTFKKLPIGHNLIAAVSSKEDHGYLMDLGVDNLKVFLTNKDLKENNIIDLNIGQLIHCSLFQVSERSLIVSVNQKLSSNFSIDKNHQPSILFYLPGVKTHVTIIGIYNSGLELSLPGGYKGFVPKHHISDELSTSLKQFKIGDVTQGHVLYVHPHTKQVCVSLRSKLKRKKVKNLLDSIRIGLIIKNAIVCAHTQFGSLIFKLPSNNYAIALKKNLFEPKEYNEESLNRLYPIGSSHRARVKKFLLMDNLIEISLRKSFIERNEISLDDIEIGNIVEGDVKKYRPDGIYVKLGFCINGFIPNIHLTDAPFLNLEKTRDKLFPLKKKIQCRVLKLDYSSKIPKIALTAKKSLLKMSHEEIFKDLNEITPRMSSTGVVCLINDNGILLEFFNRIRGFVPLKYLATYKIEHPEKVFQLGQLVKCTVVSVDIPSQRIVCSLVDVSELKHLKMNLKIKNKNDSMNSKLQVGQILKRMKIISKIPTKGFDLTHAQEKIQVFLPIYHLSDDPHISRIMFNAYKIDDVIGELMVFSKDSTNVVCVTKKPVFLQQNYQLVRKEEDIEINSPFPAIVRHITSTGVFFETPNSQYGLIRKKYLQDGFFDEPQKLELCKGQTIFVNPFEISTFEQLKCDDNYFKRFKFSMKLSHVWNKNSNFEIGILKSSLDEHDLTRSLLKNSSEDDVISRLASYSIGQIITYMVTEVTNEYIKVECNLSGNKNEPTVSGIAFKYTNFFNVTISEMGNAIVCDINFDKKNLILFIQPKPAKLIRQVKNFQKSNLTKIKVNQLVKGTVIHINEKHALVVLSGHVPGLIAFIPTKKHYNDLRHVEKLYSIGQSYQFSIEYFEVSENRTRILASLHRNSKKSSIKPINDISKNESILELNEKSTEIIEEKVKPKLLSLNKSTKVDKFDWNVIDLSKLNNKRKLDDWKKSDNDNNVEMFDWDSDSDEELSQKKRKSRDERNEEARQRELFLRQKENQLTDTDRTPQDEQDFEMAIVASPNSSLVWIKYMAFFLERKEINKARNIGERALSKISLREEKERINIWISLLNLENNYGDENSMKELLEKAIKLNDSKTIYSRLAIIYDESNKKEKAEQIYNLMIKKFHSNESVWIDFLLFYMKNGYIDSARKLFQKSLISLEKRHHVDLISKFAQMEFRYGDCEHGKTIFENLLATYWKRLDKWSIYIDMLIKYTLNGQNDLNGLEFIRNLFERLLTFKLSPHKKKFIFKKYYDFESKYSGDNVEVLEKLKQKAIEYVENGIDF